MLSAGFEQIQCNESQEKLQDDEVLKMSHSKSKENYIQCAGAAASKQAQKASKQGDRGSKGAKYGGWVRASQDGWGEPNA